MATSELWTAFTYRDFHDVPRAIVVNGREGALFLSSEFIDEGDDYSDLFEIYWMEGSPKLEGSWETLPPEDSTYLGSVPVRQVRFDESLRQRIDLNSLGTVAFSVLDRFTTG